MNVLAGYGPPIVEVIEYEYESAGLITFAGLERSDALMRICTVSPAVQSEVIVRVTE
jgi:spore coat polysaccharide biosynthesis protein SpsF (cytidylyltransferase family)